MVLKWFKMIWLYTKVNVKSKSIVYLYEYIYKLLTRLDFYISSYLPEMPEPPR
jgi:hypothetical protein